MSTTRPPGSIHRLVAVAALVAAASTLGCRGGATERTARARVAEWSALEREHQALEARRAELGGEIAAVEGADPRPEPARGEGPGAPAPESEARLNAATARFLDRLVVFINRHASDRADGSPEDVVPEVTAAIGVKSAEDLLLAREYVERAGDYAKAIDILEQARVADPGNRALAAALAEAERLRYMDAERFARVEPGMSQDEVRQELGQVKPQNVRSSDDGATIAWLYPRESGAAAAVFFRRTPAGALEVWDTEFEAVSGAPDRAGRGSERDEPVAD